LIDVPLRLVVGREEMPSRYLLALTFVLLLPRPGLATKTTTEAVLTPRPQNTALTSRTAVALAPHLIIAKPMARTEATLLPPVKSACISSPFGPRILPNRPLAGTYHYGVDLPAPEGAPVLATAPGKLIRIQHSGPGGLEILVQHDGFVGVYSHLGMVAPTLAEGGKMTIAAGEELGIVGHTGVTYGMHLYFEMLLGGKAVDPAPYLGVSQCNGGVHSTRADMLDADGKISPTRHYTGLN
jgi:murein DD-endopeptidase MepM/ murein hydrolase activator NlpD